MPRLPALDPEKAGGVHDNLLQTIAAAPELARSTQAHSRVIMEHGTVSQITKELCATMVAALNFCQPSLIAHRKRARELGVDADTLNAIWEYARSDRFSDAQKAALAAAVALTREPRALPDAVWNDLRRHYSDAGIVEILSVIGLGNYLDRVSNALQTDITREP